MADLSITAGNVLAGAGADTEWGVAGEALTQGVPVYKSSADDKFYKADANDTAAKAAVYGIALTSSGTGQRAKVLKSGTITIGATVAVGTVYVLSETVGLICPDADIHVTPDGNAYKTVIGIATTTAVLDVRPFASGVKVPS